MPQYITTIDLLNMPASTAVGRIFQYNVLHQTPAADAVLKRHAIMILSGHLRAARRERNEPQYTDDAALIHLICKLLRRRVQDHQDKTDRTTTILRKLFKATGYNDLQTKRLLTTCRPEITAHSSQITIRRQVTDIEEQRPEPMEVIERRPARKKIKEKTYNSPEDFERDIGIVPIPMDK